MPVVSKHQWRLFEAVAHGDPKALARTSLTPAQAKEALAATPGYRGLPNRHRKPKHARSFGHLGPRH